jgi:hypothetical protein
MADKVRFIRVKKDGVTINLVAGAGNSQVCTAGQEFPESAVPDHIIEAIDGADPYTLEMFEVVEKDAPKPGAAASPAGDQFDPSEKNLKEVLQHLESSDAAEVRRVKAAEKKGKKRKSIADFKPNAPSGAGQQTDSSRSSGGPPVPQYDDLDAAQVVALLRANADNEDFSEKVRAYEASNQARDEILNYDPATDLAGSGVEQPSTEGAA